MKTIKFTKMEGAGNDYVYVNLFKEKVPNPKKLAVEVSHRRYGIGSDGLILIAPSDVADVQMIMFNADGSQSEMCGNGIRCVGKYAYDHGLVDKKVITAETGAGILELTLNVGADNKVDTVKVSMGIPELNGEKIPSTVKGDEVVDKALDFDGTTLKGTMVSMGNPHFVTFVESAKDVEIEKIGPKVHDSKYFPNRINTEFVEVISRNELIQRTWERGAGETWACGTGASAVCVAGVLTGKTDSEVLIHLTGGDLKISWNGKGTPVMMEGPAREVYSGVWELKN